MGPLDEELPPLVAVAPHELTKPEDVPDEPAPALEDTDEVDGSDQ